MKEKTSTLNNMSSSSRSSVNVRPRHVDSPTLGTRIRSDVGVRISLSLRRDISMPADESHFITEMAKRFIPDHRLVDPVNYEEKLREFANNVIDKYKLVGCMILAILPFQPGDNMSKATKWRQLENLDLTFAILSKSSQNLFVASKTPNLSPQLFERIFITFDPRIIAIAEREK